MKVVQESAEHHFLTLLDKLRQDAAGWVGLHVALSRRISHEDLIDKPDHIKGKLFKRGKEADAVIASIQEKLAALGEATIYLFADHDVILLARPQNEKERKDIGDLAKDIAAKLGDSCCRISDLARDVYDDQQRADREHLGA